MLIGVPKGNSSWGKPCGSYPRWDCRLYKKQALKSLSSRCWRLAHTLATTNTVMQVQTLRPRLSPYTNRPTSSSKSVCLTPRKCGFMKKAPRWCACWMLGFNLDTVKSLGGEENSFFRFGIYSSHRPCPKHGRFKLHGCIEWLSRGIKRRDGTASVFPHADDRRRYDSPCASLLLARA